MTDAATSEARIVTRLRAAGCVFAEEEARLLLASGSSPWALAAMVARREAGEPLEHVLGWVAFRGLRLSIGPGVFVPRRRTEFLADEAAALTGRGSTVIDLCCGSGAIGAAVMAAVDEVQMIAADIDAAAVACARLNLEPRGGLVFHGDLLHALPPELRGRVDVLACNAPYVPTQLIATMPAEARVHEPRHTLDGGGDGLDIHRRLADEAPEWLAPGGSVLVEAAAGEQAQRSAELFRSAGLSVVVRHSPRHDATVVIARRSP